MILILLNSYKNDKIQNYYDQMSSHKFISMTNNSRAIWNGNRFPIFSFSLCCPTIIIKLYDEIILNLCFRIIDRGGGNDGENKREEKYSRHTATQIVD
jgi:hypothetical protein